MIYCVIPAELEGELYDKLVAYYADNPNVEVIVDRRSGPDRRTNAAICALTCGVIWSRPAASATAGNVAELAVAAKGWQSQDAPTWRGCLVSDYQIW